MERLNLYPHNEESSKRIIDAFNNGENVVGIVHATGTGKTFNALSLCLENKDKKIVYLVPSKAVIEHVKKLIQSNPNLSLEYDFPNLEFRTYQSLCNLSTQELRDISVDYLILDEFHHIGSPIWGDRVNTIIKTHPNIKVFGMTAYTVRDRGTAYERDMANPEGKELFSNKIVNTYDLSDAMIEGVLPLPVYRSAYTRLHGMAKELEERLLSEKVNNKEKQKYLELLDAAKRRIDEAPTIKDVIIKNLKKNGKYIYFCPPGATDGVNDVETIKKEILGWLSGFVDKEDIVFYQTTSELGDIGIENRECFYNDIDLDGKSVAGKLRIMFAINQYNEGVHAPNIDGVILGRGTSSDIIYFEQIGRALSVRGNTYEEFNKYMEYSIDELREIAQKRNIDTSKLQKKEQVIEKLLAPVIIDLANNIKFIKELENNLKERVKKARMERPVLFGSERLIPNVSFDIEVLNEELFNILADLRERMRFKTWDESFELAKAYYEYHGNLDVLASFCTKNGYLEDKDGDSFKLGIWINSQRIFYKKKMLSDDKIKKLESIGIKWTIYIEWEYNFNLAKAYYEHYGNLELPVDFKTKNGYTEDTSDGSINLSVWILSQRQYYKKGILSEEKIKMLESINMCWDVLRDRWQKNYELAREFMLKNGHLNIPFDYIIDGVKLGTWINNQRANYRKGILSKERIEALEKIGIKWSIINSKSRNRLLCNEYNLDCEKYPDLLKIPYEVLLAEINYLNSNNIPLISDDKISPIFFMSDINMQVVYGISLEDLVKEYFNNNKKGGK